jgi:hypothetical protein
MKIYVKVPLNTFLHGGKFVRASSELQAFYTRGK